MAEFNNKDKSHSSVGLNNAKAIEDAKNNANKTIHPTSQHKDHDSHHSKHKQVNGNHSFVHPQDINKNQDNEQEVKCDCGKHVPVSLINQNVEVAVIGQQSQNTNNTNTKAATIIDKNSPSKPTGLQIDTSTSPATVIENGVKSNANLYAHDQRVQDVVNGKVQTTTKVVDTTNDGEQVNVLGTSPASKVEKEAREKANKSSNKKD